MRLSSVKVVTVLANPGIHKTIESETVLVVAGMVVLATIVAPETLLLYLTQRSAVACGTGDETLHLRACGGQTE